MRIVKEYKFSVCNFLLLLSLPITSKQIDEFFCLLNLLSSFIYSIYLGVHRCIYVLYIQLFISVV